MTSGDVAFKRAVKRYILSSSKNNIVHIHQTKMAQSELTEKGQKATANVFAMFNKAQVKSFKEAFNMIDQNHDGFIDVEDLRGMYASLGEMITSCNDDYIKQMIRQSPGPINFTMFLTLFGERLIKFKSSEDAIKKTFGYFDKKQAGVIQKGLLKKLLMTKGNNR